MLVHGLGLLPGHLQEQYTIFFLFYYHTIVVLGVHFDIYKSAYNAS
jgi:hypothetical protein